MNAIYLAIILASLYGLTDEIPQAYVPGRDCSFMTGFLIYQAIYGFIPQKIWFGGKRQTIIKKNIIL